MAAAPKVRVVLEDAAIKSLAYCPGAVEAVTTMMRPVAAAEAAMTPRKTGALAAAYRMQTGVKSAKGYRYAYARVWNDAVRPATAKSAAYAYGLGLELGNVRTGKVRMMAAAFYDTLGHGR